MRGSLLSVVFLLCCLGVQAQPSQDEDFVRVSLLTLGPGDEVYSLYGHTALRMQCPSHGLDYCFTFEMALTPSEKLKFLFSTAKAGFIAAATDVFLHNYESQGRSITEHQLNLTPTEEQTLWRLLDEDMGRGPHWDYSFLTTNCSSMCIWIVEQALATEGEHIAYGPLPSCLTGTYRDLLAHISADAPWARLFWILRMGTKGQQQGQLADKLAPALLEEAWQQASLVDSAGRRRPVFAGQPRLLARQLHSPEPAVVTPVQALLLAIIIIILTIVFIKKRKLMKKAFTSLCGRRLVLLLAVVLASTVNALAGGEDWYAYKIQVDTYPTGAGLVYVDETDLSAYSLPEGAEFKESLDIEVTTTNTYLNLFAQPNEGWSFVGFVADTLDAETGLYATDWDNISRPYESGYTYMDLTNGAYSQHYDESTGSFVSDDSLTVSALMPLDPNNIFHALFTRVSAEVAPGQSAMGAVDVEPLLNNIGDKVTLTATADNEFCTFVGWTLDGKTVSTEPTLTVDVTGGANYVANFTDSRTLTLHFPEEGGYQLWYNKFDYSLSGSDITAYSPYIYYSNENSELVDSLNDAGSRVSHLDIIGSSYAVSGKKAAVLYGYGDVTISPSSGYEADDDEGDYSTSLFRWSGEEGVADVASLPQGIDSLDIQFAYYAFELDRLTFTHVTSGAIAPNSLYMRIFTNMIGAGLEAPEVIYFDEETFAAGGPVGISTVRPEATSSQAVYDLQGHRVSNTGRGGIYVTDGRKVVYRKR